MIVLLISVFIVLFLIILMWFILKRTKKESYGNNLIWTYWNDDNKMPYIVKLSIKSWELMNPEYKITILNEKNICQYLDISSQITLKKIKTQQRKSDFLRLYLLDKYGGIWIDASIVMYHPLKKWLPKNQNNYDLIGYEFESWTTASEYPVIESWFLMTPKRELINEWKKEFLKAIEMGDDNYLKLLKSRNINLQKIRGPKYLIIHCALQAVLQSSKNKYKIYKYNAEEEALFYLVKNKWNSHRAVNYIMSNKSKNEKIPNLLKLRGPERIFIRHDKIESDSLLGKIIQQENLS